jgi:hypothetical protein
LDEFISLSFLFFKGILSLRKTSLSWDALPAQSLMLSAGQMARSVTKVDEEEGRGDDEEGDGVIMGKTV